VSLFIDSNDEKMYMCVNQGMSHQNEEENTRKLM